MNAASNAADERTLRQWAELAEQAVRVLGHRTRPAAGELTDPRTRPRSSRLSRR